MLFLYTDGSTPKNGKGAVRGGCGFALYDEHCELITSKNFAIDNSTNNRAEMIAAIEGIKYAIKTLNDHENMVVYSDSAYLVNCYKEKWYQRWMMNGWVTASHEPVKNKEIWQQLVPFFEDHRIGFTKVKGHHGLEPNELVDKLAVEASNNLEIEIFDWETEYNV